MVTPFDAAAQAFKLGMNTTRENDAPVRVAVYLDATATSFLIDAVRQAFVPQTTSALVRVERLSAHPVPPKPDTDVVLVLSCGSPVLEEGVRALVIAGAPVCVIAESSVEVPFIAQDTPLLGLVAATEANHLTEDLARWILDRTEKEAAFAANFPFMRQAASTRIVTTTALANMATGAVFFVPGANYPVMLTAEIGMLLRLSAIYGYPLRLERGYEIGAVALSGLVLRALARGLCRSTPHLGFIVRALVAGFGTYGMGCALTAAYAHGIDYAPVNDALSTAVDTVRDRVSNLRHTAASSSPEGVA